MNDASNEEIQQWIDSKVSVDRAVALSVVIPAYNEERRLPPTLIDIIDYLDAHGPNPYEIIVVDDGSSDGTAHIVDKFSRIRPQVRLIRLAKNMGKGHAVRTGMINSYGARAIFADADGATPFQEFSKLHDALDQGSDLAIGSRALRSREVKIVTHWHRRLLGRIYNTLVNMIAVPNIADTQCGFKLFSQTAAQTLFRRQTADGFSFDVEILLLAQRLGLKISEVPVNWTNIPGSKVNLIADSLKMFRDLLGFRIRHRNIS